MDQFHFWLFQLVYNYRLYVFSFKMVSLPVYILSSSVSHREMCISYIYVPLYLSLKSFIGFMSTWVVLLFTSEREFFYTCMHGPVHFDMLNI